MFVCFFFAVLGSLPAQDNVVSMRDVIKPRNVLFQDFAKGFSSSFDVPFFPQEI